MNFFAPIVTSLVVANTLAVWAQPNIQEPVAWGVSSGNVSCVIFVEGHKTTGKFYGVAITTKTVGKLTFLEAQNYSFDQKDVIETQENMDNLMQMAQKDHIKFVKIPEKYSSELLEKARTACKSNAQ